MKSTKLTKRLAPVVVAFALLQGFASPVSATPNTVSDTLSDTTPGATSVSHTFLMSGYNTATAIKCIKAVWSNNSDGTTSLPTGSTYTGTAISGSSTLVSGTWTADSTNSATGSIVYNNSSGVAPTGSAKNIIFTGTKNSTTAAGGTYYLTVTTYDTAGGGSSGACGGSAIDTVTVAYATTANTTVSTIVDPSLTFTVAGRSSVCNGQSGTNFQTGATSTAVGLGHVTSATTGGGAQDLTLSTNAGGGFTVYVRTSGTTPNSMSDGNGHTIADVSGTRASPGSAPTAGTAGFGYTSNDTSTAFTSNTWAKLTNTNDSVMVASSGTMSKTACVGYQVAASTTTAAGAYSTNVVYTAVPVF